MLIIYISRTNVIAVGEVQARPRTVRNRKNKYRNYLVNIK